MHVAHHDELAFHLIGRRASETLAPVEGRALLPALLAPYRDMAALRHDFPLVLAPGRPAQSLSSLCDAALEGHARDAAGERLAGHARRIERMLRHIAAESDGIGLDEACRIAAQRLGREDGLGESLAWLRAALPAEAVLADCNRGLAARLLVHEWTEAQRARSARLGSLIADLARRLDDILKADFAASAEAHTPERLRAGMGTTQQPVFNFDVMARLLTRTPRQGGLEESRRRRIAGLLGVLRRQRFVAMAGAAVEPYGFAFDSCADALRAWRERQPEAAELARAIAMSRLEAAGEYEESRHDALFASSGEGPGARAAARDFPDYLVLLAGEAVAAETPLVLQAFGAGLPFKVLARRDDLLEEATLGQAPALAVDTLAMTSVSLGEVYVMQAAASQLLAQAAKLRAGLAHGGPALYAIFSGAGPDMAGLAPYMVSAAAVESRVFPCFVYSPAAGSDWASRFSLDGNPQPQADWPLHALEWEDAACHRCGETQAFTAVEFLAADSRLAPYLAAIAPTAWTPLQVPPGQVLADSRAQPPAGQAEGQVPAVLMADAQGRVHRVVAGEALLGTARRCQARWRLLQELGGIGNSHAARAVAALQQAAPAPELAPEPVAAPAPAPEAAAEPATARDPDVPYIETARCSSCNECVRLNGRMFVYDANGQATLADATAGTYRQLVEAAESCSVAAIHPGKPLDPKEPGLDDLIKRAEPFL